MKKVAKNGGKVKAVALLFCGFFAPFARMKKVDENEGMFCAPFSRMKEKVRENG